jgi:hypothetical protein
MIIATVEPSIIVRGDTIKWIKTLADYPAPTWALKYAFRGVGSIDVTSTASGSDHSVTLSAAASAAYLVGSYSWSSYVEQGAERYTIGIGNVTVKENPIAAGLVGAETRTIARVILDALLTAYKTYAATNGAVKRYQIADREMEYKDSASLLKDIQYWRLEVQKEEQAARLAAGLGGNPNRIFTRFTTVI